MAGGSPPSGCERRKEIPALIRFRATGIAVQPCKFRGTFSPGAGRKEARNSQFPILCLTFQLSSPSPSTSTRALPDNPQGETLPRKKRNESRGSLTFGESCTHAETTRALSLSLLQALLSLSRKRKSSLNNFLPGGHFISTKKRESSRVFERLRWNRDLILLRFYIYIMIKG